MKKAGIYIHIPFCKKRCAYCSFISSEGANEGFIQDYFSALKKEIENKSAGFKDYGIQTVYFGGGTPSFPDSRYISDTLKAVKDNYFVTAGAEISMEANPATVTDEKLGCYLSAGVNRFSIGLQSASDKLLETIGRAHNARDFVNTVGLLKSAGVKNISADIMLGLPVQTLGDVSSTLEILEGLKIPHISAYGLKVEEGTRLYTEVKNGSLKLPGEDECADMYEYVLGELGRRKIFRYEVSNFALKGFECRHNLNYWRRGEYIGFGAAAHSFTGNTRYNNTENIADYVKITENGGNPAVNSEEIPAKDAEFEFIMLGLRTAEGINLSRFQTLFKADFTKKYEKALKKLNGLIIIDGCSARASDRGFMVLSSVLVEFME